MKVLKIRIFHLKDFPHTPVFVEIKEKTEIINSEHISFTLPFIYEEYFHLSKIISDRFYDEY